MSTATTDAPPARLKARYLEEIRPALIERFGYSSVMQAPRLEKITLNMGVGLAKQDSKVLKAATEQLATIAGQQPSVRRARKSIAAFKLREGMPVGVAVTLRGERTYEFLDRLMSVAIPRIRDFRGLSHALVRRPRQLLDGRARADHLPRDRLRRDRSGARAGHHDHHQRVQRSRGLCAVAGARHAVRPAGAPEGLRPRGRQGRGGGARRAAAEGLAEAPALRRRKGCARARQWRGASRTSGRPRRPNRAGRRRLRQEPPRTGRRRRRRRGRGGGAEAERRGSSGTAEGEPGRPRAGRGRAEDLAPARASRDRREESSD